MTQEQIDALKQHTSEETTENIQPNFNDVKTVANNISYVVEVANAILNNIYSKDKLTIVEKYTSLPSEGEIDKVYFVLETGFFYNFTEDDGYTSKTSEHIQNKYNPHNVTKTQIGLGQVANKSEEDMAAYGPIKDALDTKENNSNKNISNGYAGLDSNGKLPSTLLPTVEVGQSNSNLNLGYEGTFPLKSYTIDENGRVTNVNTTTARLPSLPTINNSTISISGNNGLSGGGNFELNGAEKTLTLSHMDINLNNISVSASKLLHKSSFSAISNITVNNQGHITGITTKEYNLDYLPKNDIKNYTPADGSTIDNLALETALSENNTVVLSENSYLYITGDLVIPNGKSIVATTGGIANIANGVMHQIRLAPNARLIVEPNASIKGISIQRMVSQYVYADYTNFSGTAIIPSSSICSNVKIENCYIAGNARGIDTGVNGSSSNTRGSWRISNCNFDNNLDIVLNHCYDTMYISDCHSYPSLGSAVVIDINGNSVGTPREAFIYIEDEYVDWLQVVSCFSHSRKSYVKGYFSGTLIGGGYDFERYNNIGTIAPTSDCIGLDIKTKSNNTRGNPIINGLRFNGGYDHIKADLEGDDNSVNQIILNGIHSFRCSNTILTVTNNNSAGDGVVSAALLTCSAGKSEEQKPTTLIKTSGSARVEINGIHECNTTGDKYVQNDTSLIYLPVVKTIDGSVAIDNLLLDNGAVDGAKARFKSLGYDDCAINNYQGVLRLINNVSSQVEIHSDKVDINTVLRIPEGTSLRQTGTNKEILYNDNEYDFLNIGYGFNETRIAHSTRTPELIVDNGNIDGGQFYLYTNDYGKAFWMDNLAGTFRMFHNTNGEVISIDGLDKYTRLIGVYNNTTTNASNVYVDSGGNLLRSTSSKKYKTNIEDIEKTYVDNFFKNARPIYYKSISKIDNPEWGYWGFIAEQIAAFDKRLVQYQKPTKEVEVTAIIQKAEDEVLDDDGNVVQEAKEEIVKTYKKTVIDEDAELLVEGVQYDRITVLLTAKVQEQDKVIKSQQVLLDDLLKRIEILEKKVEL